MTAIRLSITFVDVQRWVLKLVQGKEDYVRLSSVGKSTLGKNIPVLDIYRGEAKNKEFVILLTRQHPPEVTGFLAFKSFLGSILKKNDLSNSFLEKYPVLAFPIL